MRRALVAVLALTLWTGAAWAWWAAEWAGRKPITVDPGAGGVALEQPLSEVPVLLRLHAGNFGQFLNIRDGGADLRLVAGDDQTPLDYHVERFDPVSQIAMVWVELPALAPQAAGNELYMYFGNQAAPKADDPGGTFDVNTVAAFHFNESAGLPVDSTAYGTRVVTGEVFANPASLIGTGATLAGTEALVIGEAPQLQMSADAGWTFSVWLRVNELPAERAYLFDRQDGASRLSLALEGANLVARYGDAEVSAFTPITAGQWQHLSLVLGNGQMQLFLDGRQVGGTAVTLTEMGGALLIGGSVDGGGEFAGDIDELRLSNVARSAAWVAFSAAIQGERNDALVRYGADETSAGGGEAEVGHGGYFGVIWQNVFGKKEAVVEQAVIILCGLMAALSLLVIFFKFMYLSSARNATNRFLRAYQGLGLDAGAESIGRSETGLDSLYDDEPGFGGSPLFRVYRQGVEEVRRRHVAHAAGAQAAGLDEKAISTLRAALDAVMVREGQRMNAQMVLLTIAISGGPFIGLFGTVVGVMVTFAAIAATGDVNITAIAPGMAAALLATVAGLGVAIPALFGYNYLNSRIKEISADMHVFADDLLARINEEYGA